MLSSRETVQRLTAERPRSRRDARRASAAVVSVSDLHPLGVGESLDLAAELLKRRFLALILPAFVLWLPAQTCQLFDVWPLPADLASRSVYVLFANLALSFATSMLVSGATALIAFRSLQGSEIGLGAATWVFITRLPVLVVVNVVSVLAVSAGVFTCGILSLFFAWKFLLAQVVAVLERVTPAQALGRSWILVRGGLVRWLGIFAVALVITLPFQLGADEFLSGRAQTALARHLPFASTGFIDVLSVVFASLLAALSSAFYGVLITVFYIDCRVRGEAFDLFVGLRQMSREWQSRAAGAL